MASPELTTARPRVWEWLLAALVVGLAGFLAYPWGASLITGLILGRPDRGVLTNLLATGAALAAAGATVAARPRLRTWRWPIGLAALAIFTIANVVVVAVSAAETAARIPAAVLYVASSLVVVWALLLLLWPLPWWKRLAVLAGSGALFAAFLALIRIDGLSGDAQVVFGWRRDPLPAALPATVAGAGAVAPTLEPGPNDFAGYLGPARDGRLTGPELDADWENHPPREVWRRAIGDGWGGFAVVGDAAITQEQRGDREVVVCYDLATGAERWIHSAAVRFDSSYGGPGPRATPTVTGGRVYTMGATGRLSCLAADGAVVWEVDTVAGAIVPPPPLAGAEAAVEAEPASDGELLAHGMAGSPLVVDDRVYVSPSGRDGRSLAAYDAATGRELFRAGSERASYSSPMLRPVAAEPCLLVFNGAGLAAHDPADGTVRWSFPWTNDASNNCAQPLVIDDHRVLLSTGYGTGSVFLDVSRADGAWQVQELWRTRDFKSKFATPVLLGECVYGLDDGILACLDLATGKRRWKKGRYGHGQVLLVGSMLLVQTEAGPVVLVEPRPDGPIEHGRIDALADKTWNTLTLAGDRLLVRNAVEAACYELPLVSPPAGSP
jgi:outer membrane protein assembly factor BamB